MSISSIASNLTTPQSATTITAQTRKDFKVLSSDLQTGNLASAQQDFAALMQDVSQLQNQSSSGSGAPATNSLDALSTALQSGNLGGAQTAMASLQQTLRGHHHYHHHHGGAAQAPATSTPATSEPSDGGTSPASGISAIATI